MRTNIIFIFIISLSLPFHAAYSEQAASTPKTEAGPSDKDLRQLASIPERSRALMREDMQDHLAALSDIFGLLSADDFNAAAEVAENRMGKSSMGKHRGTGMGPGRYMPTEMRNMGWGMHEAATDFSKIAKQGDPKKTYAALQNLMSTCVSCHFSYRTR